MIAVRASPLNAVFYGHGAQNPGAYLLAAEHPDGVAGSPARPAVRIAFWLFVAGTWLGVAIIVIGLAGVAFYAGRPSGIAGAVTRGDSSARVLQRVGPPSVRDSDGTSWAQMAKPDEDCTHGPWGEAWLYDHWLANDALVIFDLTGHVLCVREGGSYFMIRSY